MAILTDDNSVVINHGKKTAEEAGFTSRCICTWRFDFDGNLFQTIHEQCPVHGSLNYEIGEDE